jgi:hypothetical protein
MICNGHPFGFDFIADVDAIKTAVWPGPEKSGGLKGSMQQWPAVYPLECEIPTFLVGVDLAAERSCPTPIE